jgi:hypothetical protein
VEMQFWTRITTITTIIIQFSYGRIWGLSSTVYSIAINTHLWWTYWT